MISPLGDQIILLFDRRGNRVPIRYRELRVQLGRTDNPTLEEALIEEGNKIKEFQSHREGFRKELSRLNALLGEKAGRYQELHHEGRNRCLAKLKDADVEKRRRLLTEYYVFDRGHGRVLDRLVSYLLAGSEDDHSQNEISLIRFALDYLLFCMRAEKRRDGGSAAFHSIEAARGVARNGQSAVTILATLLHDLLEDRLDQWSRELILRQVNEAEQYAAHRGQTLKQLPDEVRHGILRDALEAYNDQAAAIYYSIGLTLYSHVQLLHAPERYHQLLHSLMEMLARLSRTRDDTYYSYLKKLLHPWEEQKRNLDFISRARLLELLTPELRQAEPLLDGYLRDVEGCYRTPRGNLFSLDEIQRNTFREILAKILDRMNNTRDMRRQDNFSIPKRLYGAGYKNIYFVQAVEHRLKHPGVTFEERRLIESKFINKPKLAALFQVRQDVEELTAELSPPKMAQLRTELDVLKCRPDFHVIRSPSPGNPYDGIVLLFNDTILGDRQALESLGGQPVRQAQIALAFQAVLENFIAYPSVINDEMRSKGLSDPGMASFEPYRIQGLGSYLELRARDRQPRSDLPIKTFKRQVRQEEG